MKKEFNLHDIVEVTGFFEDLEDAYYTKVGNMLIGKKAVVDRFYSQDKSEEYNILLSFFDDELDELAKEYSFDYWDDTELILLGTWENYNFFDE